MELWRSENPIVICFGYVHSEEKKTELKGLLSATGHIPQYHLVLQGIKYVLHIAGFIDYTYATNITNAEMRIGLLVMI